MKNKIVYLIIDAEMDLSNITSANMLKGDVPEPIRELDDALIDVLAQHGYRQPNVLRGSVSELNGGVSVYQVFYKSSEDAQIKLILKLRVSNHKYKPDGPAGYEKNIAMLDKNEKHQLLDELDRSGDSPQLEYLDVVQEPVNKGMRIFVGGRSGYSSPVYTIHAAIVIVDKKLDKIDNQL